MLIQRQAKTKSNMNTETENTSGIKSEQPAESTAVHISSEPRYSFEISRKLLEVMSLFQSSDETRFTLCNTLFEIKRNVSRTELLLVSTDGRRLAVHSHEISTDSLLAQLPEAEFFAINLVGVKKLPKVKGGKGKYVSVAVFANHAEVTCDKYKYKAEFCKGTFPTWRQVLPTETAKPAAVFPFQWHMFEDFGAASAAFCKEGSALELIPHIEENGNVKLIEIRIPEYRSFYGILMPVRPKDNETRDANQYDWIRAQAAK